MTDQEQPLCTVGEVARQLNVCTRTVRRLIATGQLPAHRVGRVLRVGVASVTRFLEANQLKALGGDHPWPENDTTTPKESHTLPDGAVARSSGQPGSTAKKSRWEPPTPPKLSAGSSNLPNNAAELRAALRKHNLKS